MKRTVERILSSYCNSTNCHCPEIKAALKELVLGCVPDERKGKHLGHSEDDGYCYNCQEVVPEDERSSFGDWAWNSCRTETIKRIEELFK